jgi:hypothetical protein
MAAISAGPTPGASSFHVKGIVYKRTHEYFRERHPVGPTAVLEHLPTAELRAFFEQPFTAGGWYDALPIAPLIRAEARALGQPLSAYLRDRAEFQARLDVNGLYRMLLKLATPELVASRLPRMIGQVVDFGAVELSEQRKGHVVATIRGMPHSLTEWYSSAITVYCEVALGLAGAPNPRVFLAGAPITSTKDGQPLVDITYEVDF